MKIYGMEKLSLVDYDGKISCTLFTKNCNYLCPFCHNSSLVESCDNSISIIPLEEVFDYLDKRANVIDAVCISGGEPTLQPDLVDFITIIKNKGFLVKLDTNGTNPALMKELIDKQLVDYIAMDIKGSPLGYSLAIGIENYDITKVSTSIAMLINGIIPYEFRTTLVYELISTEDILAIANWIQGADKYFLQEFKDSGSCICDGLTSVPKEKALEYKCLLDKFINNVELRGY